MRLDLRKTLGLETTTSFGHEPSSTLSLLSFLNKLELLGVIVYIKAEMEILLNGA